MKEKIKNLKTSVDCQRFQYIVQKIVWSVEKIKKVKTQDLEIEVMKKAKNAVPYSKKSGFTKEQVAI